MKNASEILPGIQKVRDRFLDMLGERQTQLATHIVGTWDSRVGADVVRELEAAGSILHKIAGSAGSLGFSELGARARKCEELIVATLQGQVDCPDLSDDLLLELDAFVQLIFETLKRAQAERSGQVTEA